MKEMNDWRNAFGEADEEFKNNVYRTLDGLKRREENRRLKRFGFGLLATILLLCFMVGTVLAMAKGWGVLDFLRNRSTGVEILPEAGEIVQTGLPQEGGESRWANFTVREAVFDGQNIYIVVEVRPVGTDYLLLGFGEKLTDPISNMCPLFGEYNVTIEEYARENGKVPVHTSLGVDLNGHTLDYILEADGTLVYMVNGPYRDDGARTALELNCATALFNGDNIDREQIKRSALFVELQNTGAQHRVTSVDSAIYTDCGVRVDRITLTGSPMGIYTEIAFTVVDEERYAATDGGLWFEFIDENGDRLPDGPAAAGSILPADDSGIRYLQTGSIGALETLPAEVALRGFNSWEKNRYETHLFQMK